VKSWRSSALRKLHASSRITSPLARGPRGAVLAPSAAVPAVLVLTVPTRPGCSAALYVLVVLVGYESALALACRATRARGLATAVGAGRTRFTVLRCAGPAQTRASGRSAAILAIGTRLQHTTPKCFLLFKTSLSLQKHASVYAVALQTLTRGYVCLGNALLSLSKHQAPSTKHQAPSTKHTKRASTQLQQAPPHPHQSGLVR